MQKGPTRNSPSPQRAFLPPDLLAATYHLKLEGTALLEKGSPGLPLRAQNLRKKFAGPISWGPPQSRGVLGWQNMSYLYARGGARCAAADAAHDVSSRSCQRGVARGPRSALYDVSIAAGWWCCFSRSRRFWTCPSPSKNYFVKFRVVDRSFFAKKKTTRRKRAQTNEAARRQPGRNTRRPRPEDRIVAGRRALLCFFEARRRGISVPYEKKQDQRKKSMQPTSSPAELVLPFR